MAYEGGEMGALLEKTPLPVCERLVAIVILGIENESVYLLTTQIAVLLPSLVDVLGGPSSRFQALEGEALMVEPRVVEVDDVVIFDIMGEGALLLLLDRGRRVVVGHGGFRFDWVSWIFD